MINPTLQEVKDMGIVVGLEPARSEEWFYYYKAQGFKFSSGLEIVDMKSALWRWKRNQYRFDKAEGKRKLLPIIGKLCSERGCGMPAVYRYTSDAGYDFWCCADHMPEKVKAKYK